MAEWCGSPWLGSDGGSLEETKDREKCEVVVWLFLKMNQGQGNLGLKK